MVDGVFSLSLALLEGKFLLRNFLRLTFTGHVDGGEGAPSLSTNDGGRGKGPLHSVKKFRTMKRSFMETTSITPKFRDDTMEEDCDAD